MGHGESIFIVDLALDQQAGEPVAGDAPPQFMAGRDRSEGPGVVIEADRVVDAGRFHYLCEEIPHPVDAVVEPPRRADAQNGVVAGQGGQALWRWSLHPT